MAGNKPGPTARTLDERFWAKVHKTESCWLWTGGLTGKSGYGGIYVAQHQKPGRSARPSYAHRVSWELHFGPVPEGAHVLHSCDVRHCVNPAHLFLGDQAANMKDAASKGRFNVPRPRHARRKLSEADVAEIRRLRAAGCLLVPLAERFGVSKSAISQIALGKRRVYSAPQLRGPYRRRAA